jgi:GTP-binding protein SAR1
MAGMHKIFLFGLDRAGKTVITNFLTSGVKDTTFNPTLAPNPQLLVLKQLKSRIWDMPGQQRFRDMWVKYIIGSELMICAIDVADKPRFEEAKKELLGLIDNVHEKVSPIPPMVILFHKIDTPEAQVNLAEAKSLFDVKGVYKGDLLYLETSVKQPETLEQIFPIVNKYIKD